MPQPSLSQYLRRLWALEKFGYSLRVLIAMAGSMGRPGTSGSHR